MVERSQRSSSLVSWSSTIPIIVISSTTAAALFITTRLHIAKRKRELSEPPIPGIPLVPYEAHHFFGHTFSPQIDKDKNETLERQRHQCVDYADPETGLCSSYLMTKPAVSVLKPQHAQKILLHNTNKGEISGRVAKLFFRFAYRAFGEKNVSAMNGKEWKIHRSTAARSLQSPAALKLAQRHICNVGQALVRSLTIRAEESSTKTTTINAVQVMKMATLDVFASAALGRQLHCCEALQPSDVAQAFDFLGRDVIRRFKAMASPATHLFFLPTKENQEFSKAHAVLRGFLRESIESHITVYQELASSASVEKDISKEEKERKNNLLAQMIAINRSADTHDDARLNTEEIADALTVLLFAGYDTTANALSFALHRLATDETMAMNCVEEARRALGSRSDFENGTMDNVLEELAYCHGVILEALRMYPPAHETGRILDQPLQLEGFIIPKDTLMRVPIYQMHHDERNFPRHAEFLVERWVRRKKGGSPGWEPRLGPDSEKEATRDGTMVPPAKKEAFLPFSSGARNCVGRRFALQEGTLLLACLIKDLSFQIEDGYKLEMVQGSVLMEPKDGLPLIVRKRE